MLEEGTADRVCSWTGVICGTEEADGDSILVILTSSLSWSLIEHSCAALLVGNCPEGIVREAGGSYRDGDISHTNHTLRICWSLEALRK